MMFIFMSVYLEIFTYFLKLGSLGFGGPLSIIHSMEKDLINQRKWISQTEFHSMLSLIKTLPGPIAFMTAVSLGYEKRKFWGGLLAALGLVFPSFVMMVFLAHYSSQLSEFHWFEFLIEGMMLGTLGVMLASIHSLSKKYFLSHTFKFLVILSAAIFYYRPNLEPLMIFLFGVYKIIEHRIKFNSENYSQPLKIFFDPLSLNLMFSFFKAGALVFGSGLAIIPFLKNDVVIQNQWLTEKEFLMALTFGQLTPGPVVITVTYIGYKVLGFKGALLSTLSIFFMSFFHMTTWFPKAMSYLKHKSWIQSFSEGAIAAIVGPIFIATFNIILALDVHTSQIAGQWSYSYFLFYAIPIFTSIILIKTKKSPMVIVLSLGVLNLVKNIFL